MPSCGVGWNVSANAILPAQRAFSADAHLLRPPPPQWIQAQSSGEGFETLLGDEADDDVEEGGEVFVGELAELGEAIAEASAAWSGRRGIVATRR